MMSSLGTFWNHCPEAVVMQYDIRPVGVRTMLLTRTWRTMPQNENRTLSPTCSVSLPAEYRVLICTRCGKRISVIVACIFKRAVFAKIY